MKKIVLKFLKYTSLLVLLILSFVLVLIFYPLPEALPQKVSIGNYNINNVHIIDALNDSILRNKTVVIRKNRIEQIISSDSTVNNTYKNVNGKGKYVMAGLWDMHSHLALQVAPQITMPLHIANGVTNIRDMQGVVRINKERKLWRKQIESGTLLGPRLIGFADEIVGDNYDKRDVIKVVNRSEKDKRTFIKIYSNILADRYFKLAKEAKRKNVDFAGHYPISLNPIDASNAGQRSFEHAHLFIDYSHSKAAQQRIYNADRESNVALKVSYEERLGNFNFDSFYELVDVMIKNNTYFCPTHITKRYEASVEDDLFLKDERLKYVSSTIGAIWNDDILGTRKRPKNTRIRFYKKGLELTGLAQKRGVKILAGTDSYDPYSFPGFSIHDELGELVKAGLTPAAAIVSATINPSEYFSVSSDYGTVEEGKVADVILLNKNPLIKIQNTKSIEAVIFNGNLYNRDDLDKSLNYVEQNVSGFSGWSISTKIFLRLMKDNRPSARNKE